MAKKPSFSRRQRREMYRRAGFLRIKNSYPYFSEPIRRWYEKTAQEGRELHEAHLKMVTEQIEEKLQTILNKNKESWTSLGYNEAEMKMLEEAFALRMVKDKETWRADRKEAKRLEKEAYASLNTRK